MKKSIAIIILLSCLGFFHQAAAQVFQNDELAVTQLEDHMCVIETRDNAAMYLVEGTRKAMLIDTGTRVKNLDSIVRRITKKPLTVVITHAHGDHAGNIKFFKEIWMHPADTVLMARYRGKVHFVREGDVFDLGGTQIEVSHMPAHTPGSIVLLDRKAGNCYSGDAFGANHVWLQLKPLSPMETYVQSCLKMENLMDGGITKVYCGHYVYVKKPYDKSYITTMRQLAEALINGTAPEAQPYQTKAGCANPMSVTSGPATIVFDPDNLRQKKE
jgi:hydroxyacylglutathione hydrolase